MLDIKQIRKNPAEFAERLALRGNEDALASLIELDATRRQLIVESDQLRHSKSETERGMRTADKSSAEFAQFRDSMRAVAQRIKDVSEQLKTVESDLGDMLLQIPNIPHDSVPPGSDESANVVIHLRGDKPEFDFEPKPHWDVAGDLGLLDFERPTIKDPGKC